MPTAHDHERGARGRDRHPRRRALDRRRVLRRITSRLQDLEAAGYAADSGELLVTLVWLCLPELSIPADELNGARRRAMFVLAAGGDPHRELDLDSVAAERLAAELDTPERRKSLHTVLSELPVQELPTVSQGVSLLLGDPDAAWRCLGLALLADELADE